MSFKGNPGLLSVLQSSLQDKAPHNIRRAQMSPDLGLRAPEQAELCPSVPVQMMPWAGV